MIRDLDVENKISKVLESNTDHNFDNMGNISWKVLLISTNHRGCDWHIWLPQN